jgi:hypothetical protein
MLSPYVTPTGRVRTFASVDRFGSWAMEHDEVAPLAGLALLAAREPGQVAGIRSAVLDVWMERGWQPFWWQGRAYVCAQSLEFLDLSGGIPDYVSENERRSLSKLPIPTTAFDAAHRLATAYRLKAARDALHMTNILIDLQQSDGGWPPSSVLLVPDQRDPANSTLQRDDRRLLTTAVSVVALTRWAAPEDHHANVSATSVGIAK